jgi:hypothetical protein
MIGHQASNAATPIYLHLRPRSPTASPDQSLSPGTQFQAIPSLLTS